jgi:hypothetical protein
MLRFFLQVIIYFCSIYCFIILPANQNVWASSINESENSSKAEKSKLNKDSLSTNNLDKTKLNKDVQSNRKKTGQNSNRTPVLVPPPPPEQTSLLDWSNIGNMNESFNFLNEEELKQKLANLQKETINAQLALEETNTEMAEAKDKAERFVSLYSEGVVSRKELEVAKKQVSEKERSSQEKKGEVEDLKAQENAILRRLASLKKNYKGKQFKPFPNKKKISNAEKQKQQSKN